MVDPVAHRVPVRRLPPRLSPDPRRIITLPFIPGETSPVGGRTRIERIVEGVLALAPVEVEALLTGLRARFAHRHDDLDLVLDEAYAAIGQRAAMPVGLPTSTRRLIGAYFSKEYAIEAAALTNPSIAQAPDQAGVTPGSLRFVMSLRAVGEGHMSSIEFRSGIVDGDGAVVLDPLSRPALGVRRVSPFRKSVFRARLREIGASEAVPGRDEAPDGSASSPLDRLGERFTMAELEVLLADLERSKEYSDFTSLVVKTIHWLAASNYEMAFPRDSDLSARVLFPSSPIESRGMEDARLVRFTEEDGAVVYYATYTAYDGFHILPQLIETRDFLTFSISTMGGPAARNKGLALFPRRVGGRYAALARSDSENNYVMFSDDVHWWGDALRIQIPTWPWELVQIGNCGAPVETRAGWLVVTHGVGPLRTYALGAILLDLEDPTRVIGHLREPLLFPADDERDGYVPNVVYSCGQLIHAGRLVIAYGASDTATGFAVVDADALLGALLAAGAPPTPARM